MNKLSISSAWEATIAFVKREGTLLFPVAFVFLALPLTVLQMFAPDNTAQPGITPEQLMDLMRPMLVALVPLMIVTMYGGLALFSLAMRPGISVREALMNALGRMPVALGIALLLMAVVMVAILLFAIPFGVMGGSGLAAGLWLLIGTVALIGAMLWVGVRLALSNAVIVDKMAGPIDSLRFSWALSKGHFWKMFGFLVIYGIVATVASGAAGAVLGVVGGLVGGPETAKLMGDIGSVIVSTVTNVYLVVMLARIYDQLADNGRSVATVFE